MKLLLLTAEPVSADVVREAVGDDADDSEVMVVSPALTDSPVRFWTSDADEAIEHARETAEETVERLDEAGIDAAGDTGESDPLQALEDALVSYDADEIVLFTHAGGKQNWLEDGLVEQAKERFDAPVRHMVVD